MDEPRARSASRLADLPAGVELGEYYSRQVEARPFILHPGSRWLAAWSLLQIVPTVYNIFTVPFRMAMFPCGAQPAAAPCASADILPHAGFVVCDIVFDALCLLHIGVTAITGYRNAQGQLQLRWDAIVKRYARGWLLVDLACSLPLQLLLPWPSGWLPSLRLPRLVLAVHLPSRFRAAFKGTVPTWMRVPVQLLRLLFAVLLPAHCFGCVWFALGHVSGFGANPWVPSRRLSEAPLLERYLTALWWGIGTLLGYYDGGEVPSELVEYFFSVLVFTSGLFINS